MTIQIDYSPELQTTNVLNFILDTGQTIFKDPLPFDHGYSFESNLISGTENFPLYAQYREYYNVVQQRSIVGNFIVLIPVKQDVKFTLLSNLLIKDTVSQALKDKIVTSFHLYNPNSGIDPYDFAFQEMSVQGVTSDMFQIISSFELNKIGARQEHTEQRDALLSTYNGTNRDIFLTIFGDLYLADYFKRRGYQAILVKREALDHIENPSHDTIHEAESGSTSIIGNVVKDEARSIDCTINEITRVEIEIATVLVWPEFKQEWSWKMKKIGCVKTKLYLPTTFKRIGKKHLYAYVGKPDGLDQLIIQQIKDCASKSAILAAVIGVVLVDLPAALVAFKALFIECIKYNAGQDIKCLIPGLFFLTETGNWTQV